ncbi:YhgE/Pip domain-containing protein [Marinicrinis lubricantis]|uniref:YhgE/Pip domain-containing protein n=1 Tax=Marinicrinis lubricantis TaxID=2086470 RepID=A0ABW1IKC0_9BACL
MKQAFQAFFKQKTTMIGMMTAMMFQIIFSIVWMTGYDGVTNNVDQLKIAVVNEDETMGAAVVDNLKTVLPFQVETETALEQAQSRLDDREVQMVVHIPGDFSHQLQTPGQTVQLAYYINESNPALIKSMMSEAAARITAAVNKEAIASSAAIVLSSANVPADQLTPISQGISERVTSQFQYTNTVPGMSSQMIPMMMVLASYVGAMIMAMNLEQSSMMLGQSISKWRKFGVRSLINIISAAVISLVGSSLVVALGAHVEQGFLSLWMFQGLFLMTFMFVSQIFVILFGVAGMLCNIILLSAQLVSSGAMVPRELLSDFYTAISSIFPATYAVEGSMNILFGGPSAFGSVLQLLLIMAGAVVIGLLGTALKREKTPAVRTADLH